MPVENHSVSSSACGLATGLVLLGLLVASSAPAAVLGWQTFSNCGAGNDTGVCDSTPENNSTYDMTPVGRIGSAGAYLSGALGTPASAAGRRGRGQQTNPDFLNGPGFGDEAADASRLIVNVPMADGSPGTRIGPNGSSIQGAPNGTSSWKFSTTNDARTGDFRLTNESDYFFVLDFLHFDARVGNSNSSRSVEVRYLSGDGTAFDNALVRAADGSELANLDALYDQDLGPGPVTAAVSVDLAATTGTQLVLAPGASAGFRFVWTDFQTNAAESQVDNLALQGRFFHTAALAFELDPAAVSEVPVTYYVSASNGSDTANGLTPATAFATLARVNALQLKPGDELLFRSGDTWFGMLWPKGSGTSAAPIRIGAYGDGDRPVLDGDGYQASLLVLDDDHYDISGLTLTNQASHLTGAAAAKLEAGFDGVINDDGSGERVRFGLKIVAATRSLTDFTLSDLSIHDVFPTPTSPDDAHRGYGIKFESQSDLGVGAIYTISDVEMDGLTVARTGHYGVWIRPLGLDGSDDHKHDGFTLRNSSFLDTGGAGFVVVKASNVLVEDNLFDGAGSRLDPRMWQRGSGLWTFDAREVVIQYNLLRNAQGPLDSYGVHIDYNNENVVVQYNYSFNNAGGFAQILGANVDCGYRFNISVADGRRVEGVDGALQNGRIFNVSNFCNVGAGCASVGNFLYNNTVWVPNTMSPEIFFRAGSGETLFRNNLIVAEARSSILQTDMATSGVIFDIGDNLFYPVALFDLDPALTSGAHFVDPRLRMPGADDPAMYKLLPDSGAKFLGSLVPAGEDFFGFDVPAAVAPHIGAYNGNETFDAAGVPSLTGAFRVFAMVIVGLFGLRFVRRAGSTSS